MSAVHTLSDLKQVHNALKARELALREAKLAAWLASRRSHQDLDLFVRAVGVVEPLPQKHMTRRNASPEQLALPEPRQRESDDAAVLREAISDEFDAATLLETDDSLSFKRPGIGQDVLKRLRRGEWAIQTQLDLHGLRREQAREALALFVRECHRKGLRCVRIVHGKGLGSPGKAPILKPKVHSWLVQKAQVLAFVQALPSQGGAGALVVLLAPRRPGAAKQPAFHPPAKDEPQRKQSPIERMALLLRP